MQTNAVRQSVSSPVVGQTEFVGLEIVPIQGFTFSHLLSSYFRPQHMEGILGNEDLLASVDRLTACLPACLDIHVLAKGCV